MKKISNYKIIFLLLVFIAPTVVNAQRGCCSHHGGVAGCNENGRQICRDGTLSPSCTCTSTVPNVYGCTDIYAKNYNSRANKDDGSCEYYAKGCTDSSAKNYNSEADKDDGTCEYYVEGCTDKNAKNYDSEAEKDDGSCEYYLYGCMDENAINYNISAEKDDGTCEYEIENSSDNSNGFLSLLTIGGIGTGLYYLKKKK